MISFFYDKEGNRLYLREIAYGGNEFFSKLAYRSIQLNYDVKNPSIRRFVSGVTFTGEKLLKTIEVKSNAVTQWTYRLHHEQRGPAKSEVLAAVDRCWTKVCTPKTTFDYDLTESLTLKEPDALQWKTFAPNIVGPWSYKQAARTYLDLNNDGRTDILGLRQDAIAFSLAQPDGSLGSTIEKARNIPFAWNPLVSLSAVADMNKDGFNDVVLFVESGAGTGVYVSYWSGEGFSDFSLMTTKFGLGWSVKSQIRAVIDVNNDGWPDVIGSRSEGIFVAFNDGKGHLVGGDELVAKSFLGSEGWMTRESPRYFADVNADGYPDIIGV
ncbi:MAG: VCBS repeat-containing protein, partial [Acidobacteriota bacterium]